MAGTAVGAAPCSFYAAGACRNGAACRFSHAATRAPRAPADGARKARVPCKFFLANACTAGRDCKFSHDLDQRVDAIVTTSAGERKPAPGAFSTRCKFYDKGTCTTGSACPYRHVDGAGQNNSEHGSSHSGARARAPMGSSVKMYVLQPKTRKQSNATAEGAQTEGEASTQREEEDKQSGGVAQLSDFLSKEEELYYYGAPGDFDMMHEQNHAQNMEGKLSYAEIAAMHVHDDDEADLVYFAEAPPAPPKMCTFYLQGACRYGDACFYSHSLEKAPSALTGEERELVQQELKASADLECGICYDLIMAKGERFGLLSGCSHAFCLACVRNWRGNADQPKQTVRQCPVCRVDTHFVIPSNRMITDPERKKQLIREYTKNLASIPCRHFDEGRGECPFGTSCFYAHRYPTGEEEVRQVRTAVDAEGQYDVLRSMRLNHFFENLELN